MVRGGKKKRDSAKGNGKMTIRSFEETSDRSEEKTGVRTERKNRTEEKSGHNEEKAWQNG
jgi:hypothetical protein